MDGNLPATGRFASLEDDIERARALKRLRQFHQRVLGCYQKHLNHSTKEELVHDLARILSSLKT
jgi:hypothetical protein